MKKLFLMLTAVIISAGSFAQTPAETKAEKAETKFCCPKCDHSSSKCGKCAHHKVALVKEDMYYCPMHSKVTSDKPGKCSKCEMDLVKMETETVEKYACANCDWTIPPVKGKCPNSTESKMKDGTLYCVYCHDSSGKCTKCGMDMKKMEIKQKKRTGKV